MNPKRKPLPSDPNLIVEKLVNHSTLSYNNEPYSVHTKKYDRPTISWSYITKRSTRFF